MSSAKERDAKKMFPLQEKNVIMCWWVLTKGIVVIIILPYINISNHYVVHFNNTMLYVNYNSIQLEKMKIKWHAKVKKERKNSSAFKGQYKFKCVRVC